MLVSQWCMLGAVALLFVSAFALRAEMRRKPWLRRVMGALIIQAVLGTAISFSAESAALSLLLASLLLCAVGYMVLQCQPARRQDESGPIADE